MCNLQPVSTKKMLLTLMSILTISGSAYAYDDFGTLLVRVTDQKEQAIADAKVTVSSGCDNPKQCPINTPCPSNLCDCSVNPCKCCIDQHAATGSTGTVTFKVPAGSYTVSAERSDFFKKTVQEVKVSAGKVTTQEVKLQPKERDSTFAPEDQAKMATGLGRSTNAGNLQEQTTVFAGRVIDENGKAIPDVTVQVIVSGCKSGACPADLPCNSNCCDCSAQPCKCCIDQKAVTNQSGAYVISFTSASSWVDVKYARDGKAEGTFSGIQIKPKDKRVTLDVRMQDIVKSNDQKQ